MRLIIWFTNDLRLEDNLLFSDLKYTEIIPIYIFDPREFTSHYGFPKITSRRAKFLLESVINLKHNLKKIGSNLLIAIGKPEIILSSLISSKLSTTIVYSHNLFGKKMATLSNAKLVRVWNYTLYHKDDIGINKRDIPNVFTKFRNLVENHHHIRPLLKAPDSLPFPNADNLKQSLDGLFLREDISLLSEGFLLPGVLPTLKMLGFSDSVGNMNGGEDLALTRLTNWVWTVDGLKSYFDTRNEMLGYDYSSKLSPYLALGCISPRRIYHECKKYERDRINNKSTYWLVFELIWRDYFYYFIWRHGDKIYQPWGIITQGSRPNWSVDKTLLKKWIDGKTGVPLVDASMRELSLTGYMSNRGRQNVASYLVFDLGIDWRLGAAYFQSVLVDYDLSQNWGNWVAAAGLTGGRINHFNIGRQTNQYDPERKYIKHWLSCDKETGQN